MTLTPLNVPPEFFQRSRQQPSDAEKMQANGERDGTLREVITTDETGRRIRRFLGSPAACWDMFKQPSRRVVGFSKGGR